MTTQESDTSGYSKPSQVRSVRLAWGALILIGLIYGYNWVVMKTALNYAHPAVFAAMRIGFAAVTLFFVLIVLRRPLRPPNWRLTALVGLFGVTGFTGLTFWALKLGAAGKTSVLVYTMPVWLLLMSRIFLKERVRGYQWIYAAVALAGLVFVISPWSVGGTLVGNLLAVGSGMCSAVSAILAKILFRGKRVDLLALNAWQMLFGAVPLVIIAVLTADAWPQWSGWFVVTLLYNVLLASAIALMLWFYTLRSMPAGQAGLGRLIAPVIGVTASWIQLGERPDRYEIVGVLLILTGLAALAVHQFANDRRTQRGAAGRAVVAAATAGEASGD